MPLNIITITPYPQDFHQVAQYAAGDGAKFVNSLEQRRKVAAEHRSIAQSPKKAATEAAKSAGPSAPSAVSKAEYAEGGEAPYITAHKATVAAWNHSHISASRQASAASAARDHHGAASAHGEAAAIHYLLGKHTDNEESAQRHFHAQKLHEAAEIAHKSALASKSK